MSFQFEQGEILLVNKPYSWTSFDVVGKMRSMIRQQLGLRKIKIGHAGTLDPLASGLLILCTGKFTKRIDEFQGLEKEYTGTFRLGAITPSFDLETKPEQFLPFEHISEETIRDAARQFTGTIYQVPPVFSAKRIDGKRAYTYARKEIDVAMESRMVTLSAFEIIRIALPEIDFRIVCSKGTYIRSIAHDFGKLLGCGAHLTALCRTRIGSFHLRDAFELDELEKQMKTEKSMTEQSKTE